MERLCFGTFVNILGCCSFEEVDKNELVGKIIQTIDPETKYAEKLNNRNRMLNYLYKCEKEISHKYTNIKQLVYSIEEKKVIEKFENSVIPCIDPSKKELAVLALCDIICRDTILNSEKNNPIIGKLQRDLGNLLKEI